jgi:hypothetical protein
MGIIKIKDNQIRNLNEKINKVRNTFKDKL